MKIRSTAPGRICLFGEHQDYIGFPIIAAAIDLTITIEGTLASGSRIEVDLRDLNERVEFDSRQFEYQRPNDYLKSAVRVLQKKQIYREHQILASVQGNIPIQSGTSSSSALCVAWAGFLSQASHPESIPDPLEIGELAYLAEVEEFRESGGRMDQYASACGGIIHIDFRDPLQVTPLPVAIREFVLGDSRQPKDTQKTLKRIRTGYEQGFKQLSQLIKFESPFSLTPPDISPQLSRLDPDVRDYVESALINHQITNQAKAELMRAEPNESVIAGLMNQLQGLLRDRLKISTPKLNEMIEASRKAGALAAKINGSGEGGCMFAFCPGRQNEVAEAIARSGGTPTIINIGPGLEVEIL